MQCIKYYIIRDFMPQYSPSKECQAMTLAEFEAALNALDWRAADFCRATGLHRNTPSRWRNEGVETSAWVPQHMGLLLDLKRLYAGPYSVPASPKAEGWFLQDLERLHAAYLMLPHASTDD
jgi:hypothetical protein